MRRRSQMGDKIDVLEVHMGDVQATLQSLAQQMQHWGLILSEFSKQIGHKRVNPTSENSMGGSSQDESRLSSKKVKLPMFEGNDPMAWIARVEIYFDVQNTTDAMHVKLDVEEELKAEDEDGKRISGKKGVLDHMGQNDWDGLFQKGWSGLNQIDPIHSPNSGWSNPAQKTGSNGSNTISMTSLASTRRKEDNDAHTGLLEKWKGV
ncbi:hypothetical protein KIW84_058015 [Lathyrus oleraceus]|uniref:Uncharacterized protein n=1 Tax=Pisum sativum TaxID=3888 RepID=A0A9D4X2T0_PEA|nr:hypothetical protein KIW84_058015 [Pisum sativum]